MGWAALLILDGRADLANQALVLVATAAVATLWLPGWGSALAALVAVAAFNWTFVPPRHSFSVAIEQHALLLAALLIVVWTVSALMTRMQRLALLAARQAQREARLRTWADQLRDVPDPLALAGGLQSALAVAAGAPVALTVVGRLGARLDDAGSVHLGGPDADQRAGLALCLNEGAPSGPAAAATKSNPMSTCRCGRGVTRLVPP